MKKRSLLSIIGKKRKAGKIKSIKRQNRKSWKKEVFEY